jgi:hypothetical protein
MFNKIWRVVWEGRPYYEENEWHIVKELPHVCYWQNTFTGQRRIEYLNPIYPQKDYSVDVQWVETGVFLRER